MDITQIVITTAITAVVSAIVGAVVASVISAIKDKARDHSDADEAMKEGMKLLLMDKANAIVKAAINEGEITIDARVKVHEMTKAARGLGANGESHELDRLADDIPTKHE